MGNGLVNRWKSIKFYGPLTAGMEVENGEI